MPGIEDVSVNSTPPLGGLKNMAQLKFDGRELVVFIHQVDPRYLPTMKIPVLRGRTSRGRRARRRRERVAGLEEVAGSDPLGQEIKIGDEVLTVVGLRGCTIARHRRSRHGGTLSSGAIPISDLAVVVRTSVPGLWLPPFRHGADVDPNLKPRVTLLKDRFQEQVSDIQQIAVAVSILGAIALAVACLGVVGLSPMPWRRARRKWDRWLGAQSRHVVRSLVSQFQKTVIGGPAGSSWCVYARAATPAGVVRGQYDRSDGLRRRNRGVRGRRGTCGAVAGKTRASHRSAGRATHRLSRPERTAGYSPTSLR